MHKNVATGSPESFVLSCVSGMIPSLQVDVCSLCIKACVVSPKSYAGGFGTFFHREILVSEVCDR